MKTTIKFNASASLNYQKYDAEVILELAEGEKLTPADKEKFQNYVNEVAVKKVAELATAIETVKVENPSLNIDKKEPVVLNVSAPTPAVTTAGGSDPLTSLKTMMGGQSRGGDYFVRGGNHTLGEATEKELNYIANLTSRSYSPIANAARALLDSGFKGV